MGINRLSSFIYEDAFCIDISLLLETVLTTETGYLSEEEHRSTTPKPGMRVQVEQDAPMQALPSSMDRGQGELIFHVTFGQTNRAQLFPTSSVSTIERRTVSCALIPSFSLLSFYFFLIVL